MEQLMREILFAFWKVHILHHAGKGPIYGQWIITELRRHGYEISPGTLYPLLERLEQHGWLRRRRRPGGSTGPGEARRKEYDLTPQGRNVLEQLRARVAELYEEVGVEAGNAGARKRPGVRRQRRQS